MKSARNNGKNSKSGYWLVLAIILSLALPPIIGYFVLNNKTTEKLIEKPIENQQKK